MTASRQTGMFLAVAMGALLLAGLASAQMMPGGGGAGMLPGGMGEGGAMGPGGMGGQTQALVEPPDDSKNEVEMFRFMITAFQTAIQTYNEAVDVEEGRYETEKYDTDPTTNERQITKKWLYRELWAAYDGLGQLYRLRDQLADASAIYEEAIGWLPKDPDWKTFGASTGMGGMGGAMGSGGPGMMGGSSGPMMSGSGGPGMMGGSSGPMMGSSGGPMMSGGRGGMMPGGSGSMMGGPMGSGGMMGGMGGSGGGAVDAWEDLSSDMRQILRDEVLGNAYFRLAQVYYESQRISEAQQVLDENTSHVAPGHGDSWHLLVEVELLLGMDNLTAADATRALGESANATALTNLGIALYRRGKTLEALAIFREAVSTPMPEDGHDVEARVVAYNYMGVSEMARDNLVSADASFRKMIELLPTWDVQVKAQTRNSQLRAGQRRLLSSTVAAYSNLAEISRRKENHDDAVALSDAAVQAADLLVRLERSDEGASMGDMDRALAVVGAAYQNAAVARLSRGASKQHLNGSSSDYERAIDLLEKAAASAPQNPEIWNTLGKAYYRARRFYDAEQAFGQAAALNGANEEYHANQRSVRERLGYSPAESGR